LKGARKSISGFWLMIWTANLKNPALIVLSINYIWSHDWSYIIHKRKTTLFLSKHLGGSSFFQILTVLL